MSNESAAYDTSQIRVIEWHMMDKRKFYPLSVLCSVGVRGLLYPLTVVKTRLQIQRQNSLYSGTFDAFRKIYLTEGMVGLYKGNESNAVAVDLFMNYYFQLFLSSRLLD